MRKYLVLFLGAVFVSVKEINAETKEWTAGSAVSATFGPEDAVYCRLKDTRSTILYDGFGQCRITLDRVTMDHNGSWDIITGNPGTIFVRSSWIWVNVLPNEHSKLVVEPSVVSNQSSVILTCSVPKGDQVKSCIFRNPSGTLFVATPEVTKDTNDTDLLRYETFAGDNYCRLTLFKPYEEREGYWRCAVNTTSNSGYGFLDGTTVSNLLNPDHNNFLPPLESNFRAAFSFEGDTMHMSCSIHDAISYCYFRAPNGTIFNISPSTSTADYEYIGNGFDAGECGMRVNNIRKSANGRWHCTVGVHRPDMGRYYEKTDDFFVQVNERLAVTQRFESNGLIIMSLRVDLPNLPTLEYCRFVRSDGLSFVRFSEPDWYYIEMPERNAYKLNIIKPVAADVGLWTVAVKVAEQEEELITTFNLEPRPWTSRSGVFSVIFWCFLGTLILCLILGSCLPKKNREWTRRGAVRIRNSFRRQPQQQHHQQQQPQQQYPQQQQPQQQYPQQQQPQQQYPQQQQPQQQNAADLPQPVIHTDILTDLPRKV